MNLNTGIIAGALPYLTQYVSGQQDHPLVLSDIRTLPPEYGLYSENILYFAEWSALRQLSGEYPAYAVCVGGGKDAADFFESRGITGIVLDDNSPSVAFSIIQSLFLRCNQLENRLLKSLLLRETTQEVLNCCSEFFLNHVILFDSELNLIDYSTNFLPGDDDIIWRETLENKKRSDKMYSQSKKMNLTHDQAISPRSEMVDLGAGFQRHMIISFFDSTRRVASLVVVENNKPLFPCHLKLLDYISEIIGPGLNDRYATLFGSLESLRTLFVAMLNKVGVDPLVVTRCLGLMGWGMRDDFRLFLTSFPENSRNTDTLTRYLYIYENVFPECVVFKYIESLVLIVHNDTREVMAECMPVLEKQLKAHHAVCGVSLPFNSILQINSQYLIADTAIQLGDKSKTLRFVKDIITNHLINKVASSAPIIPLCHREAVRIFDYDRENRTELLLTLETYLRQNKSLKAAAEELFIHRSTMTYRLGCIDKLAKIDYDDSRERLHVLLTCIVLRNLGNTQLGP
jgi:hypothetical protein